MKTTVVHVNDPAGFDIYIGRAVPRKALADSPFGNPFIIGRDGNRSEVIRKFESYFHTCLTVDKEFRAAVFALRGKRLACWCKPADCHGDIIAAYLDAQEGEGQK